MGSPVSVVLSTIYMEDHKEKSMSSAQKEMKPKIWKRYVDDSFRIIKHEKRAPFTNHLKCNDLTCSIKFTDKPEVDKAIPFLDTLVTRTLGGGA